MRWLHRLGKRVRHRRSSDPRETGGTVAGSSHRPDDRPGLRLGGTFELEALEPRLLLTFNPTGMEQEFLEWINQMRLDPAAHLDVLIDSFSPLHSPDGDVQNAISFFDVDSAQLQAEWSTLTAAPPLAWAEALTDAARAHSQEMIDQDAQSHQLPGEASLGTRITDAGYTGWNRLGENIYAYARSGFHGHAGFVIDWGDIDGDGDGMQDPAGHRLNIMSTDYREVGIGVLVDSSSSTSVGPLVVTQDFGNRFSFGNPYLLGVAYDDVNGNARYDAGEGLGGVHVDVAGSGGTFSLTTMDAGGYQAQLPPGAYTVTFSGGGLAASVVSTVSIGSDNVKLDVLPPEVQTVTVAAIDSAAAEAGPDAGMFRLSRTGPTTEAITVHYSIGGTALGGSDYEAVAPTAVIPAGQGFVDIAVLPLDDLLVEAPETVVLTVTSDPAYSVGGADQATVNISSDDTLPQVTVAATDATAAEAGLEAGSFTVTRTGPMDQALTVSLSVGGTASSGTDYDALPLSVVIPVGFDSVALPVTPVDDLHVEAMETIVLALDSDPAYTLGPAHSATVALSSDDVAPVVTILATDTDAFEAGADVGSFLLTRSGPTSTVLTVQFTIGGTATSGADYLGLPTAVDIPAGSSNAMVTVTPIDDLAAEDPETVTLTIQGDAAYVIGGSGTDSITITDNEDVVESLDGSTPVVFIDEDGDRVTVTLRGPGSGQVTRQGGIIDQILLTGTTDRSSLKIAVSGTGTSVRDVSIDGALGTLSARTTDLTGDLTATGIVKRVQLADVAGESQINIGPGLQTTDAVTLAFGRVTDLGIHSQAIIRSLSAVDWRDTDASPIDTITAPSIGTLRITGDRRTSVEGAFEASMNLTGAVDGKATLARAMVAGSIRGGTWLVQGSAGSIRAGDLTDWTLSVDATLASLRAGRVADTTVDLGGDVRSLSVVDWAGGSLDIDGTLRSLSVTGDRREAIDGDLSTDITATAMGSMTIRGGIDASRVVLLQSVDPDNNRAVALGRATIRGAVRDTWIISAGSMGSITLGALDAGSVIYAGVGQDGNASGGLEYAELMGLPDLNADGTPDLPQDSNDFFDTLASIRSLKIRGLPGSSSYGFEGSNVAAGVVRTAHLGRVDATNTGVSFGLSTASFSQLSFTDDQANYRIRSAADLGEVSFDDDYVVRLV